jgi:nucleotide-binding universal stress UspA family protein
MIALKNILVATDFGEASDAAVAYGRELARSFGATLHVLHVADDVYVRLGGDAYVAVLPELQKDIENAAHKSLDQLLVDNDPNPLPVKKVVITSSSTASAIVQYAADAGIDLIVVGTHGRGAMAHLLMGSVAERVVRTARCPVLTVRHPEHEFVLPDALVAVAKA